MSLTRIEFNMIKELFKKQPWLEDKYDELMHLLYTECINYDEKNLTYSLIKNFLYINAEEYKTSIKIIAEYIVDRYDLDKTIIYATAYDRKPDSSQEIIYKLKTYLAQIGWIKPKIYSVINKLKDIEEGNNIVIIDEFIGSGKTMFNRYREVTQIIENKKFSNCNVSIISVVGTKEGVDFLQKKGVDVQVFYDIKKGISDTYKEDTTTYLNTMKNIETRVLSKKIDQCNMPSLGYGASESLYKREDGNTPNNVFPLFWWPKDIASKDRKTIMARSM